MKLPSKIIRLSVVFLVISVTLSMTAAYKIEYLIHKAPYEPGGHKTATVNNDGMFMPVDEYHWFVADGLSLASFSWALFASVYLIMALMTSANNTNQRKLS